MRSARAFHNRTVSLLLLLVGPCTNLQTHPPILLEPHRNPFPSQTTRRLLPRSSNSSDSQPQPTYLSSSIKSKQPSEVKWQLTSSVPSYYAHKPLDSHLDSDSPSHHISNSCSPHPSSSIHPRPLQQSPCPRTVRKRARLW
jgi:hypothetical protein